MTSSLRIRVTVATATTVTAALLAGAGAAQAAIPSVLGGDVSCEAQADGVRFCGSDTPRSTSKTFDGVPIDVNVAFPPEPASGADGNYPLVMLFHGYGGGKLGLSVMRRWLDRGYATFSMTDRGFRESCGSPAARLADPTGCGAGYVRLIDTRYEVRDAQQFAGRLVDQGLVDPRRIAAIGGSYGGAISLALAALRDRTMLADGSLVPWRSPAGTPMQLAAAAPSITWSDLAYALAPNGGTLDYVADAPYRGRFGVEKESLVNGLYISGLSAPGFYAPPGTDPSADLTGWKALLDAGEPYDDNPAAQALRDEVTAHHSAYYIDDAVAPAPTLFANGFTDDLFPVDEAIRYYNRVRSHHPDAAISLFFGEVAGHPRSASKADVNAALAALQLAWFDHYVKGEGEPPLGGVEVFTQTCPADAPSGGPIIVRNWARAARGELRLRAKPARTIAAGAGDPAIAASFDPVTGGGSCAQTNGADQPGVATYRLGPAPAGGYTLLGSPTVSARFTLAGESSQVAARLLDVAPDGQQRLIARGLWRPSTGGPSKQVFQLHANAWQFAAGHVPKLELLPADDGGGPLGGYGRPSNGQAQVSVSRLELRLPVRERPGSLDGEVKAPKRKLVPKGYELASDFAKLGDPRARPKGKPRLSGNRLKASLSCPRRFAACTEAELELKLRAGSKLLADGLEVRGGKLETVRFRLSREQRTYLASHRDKRVTVTVASAETRGVARKRTRVKRV